MAHGHDARPPSWVRRRDLLKRVALMQPVLGHWQAITNRRVKGRDEGVKERNTTNVKRYLAKSPPDNQSLPQIGGIKAAKAAAKKDRSPMTGTDGLQPRRR